MQVKSIVRVLWCLILLAWTRKLSKCKYNGLFYSAIGALLNLYEYFFPLRFQLWLPDFIEQTQNIFKENFCFNSTYADSVFIAQIVTIVNILWFVKSSCIIDTSTGLGCNKRMRWFLPVHIGEQFLYSLNGVDVDYFCILWMAVDVDYYDIQYFTRSRRQ